MSFVVWLTGLPGSGKSTIASELLENLRDRGVNAAHLRLDEFRKQIIPDPKFNEEERELVYGELSKMAAALAKAGKNVIVDAAAHRKKWRDNCRAQVNDFLEVFVRCGLETCIERESKRTEGLVTANMYKKALERRKTGKKFDGLGDVVGVDVPYEDGCPDMEIDSEKLLPKRSAEMIISELKRRGFIND